MADSIVFCHRCGIKLKAGGTRYVVKVSMTADFDGFLPDEPDDPHKEVQNAMDEVWKMSAEALEADVHQTLVFLLCRTCKILLVERLKTFSTQKGQALQ